MNTLYLVRSPLLKRKKRLGLFKSKKKEIGKLDFSLTQTLEEIQASEVIIISTSFTRHKKTVGLILNQLLIKGKPYIIIDSNLQDKDMHDTLDFLSRTSNRHKHLVLITSREVRINLLKHFTSENSDIPVGTTQIIKLNINSWSELKEA